MAIRQHRSQVRAFVALCGAFLVCLASAAIVAIVAPLDTVELLHDAAAVHADQYELMGLSGQEAYLEAFEIGDALFATAFNALDGGGAHVGAGQRYTRIPRADLKGEGEWFLHTPKRVTGPNAAGCFECHETPFEDGAGAPSTNVHRDPFRTGKIEQFVQRNTPHVFAIGAVQRLAEEMTDDLAADQARLAREACNAGGIFRFVTLATKGVDFGILAAKMVASSPCRVEFNTSLVEGIDVVSSVDNPDAGPQLIVRPFQWKGSVAFLRDFNRGAAHNDLGMQAVEIVGDNVDGDHDGVTNEMTIGDQTALAVYMAAQPRPTTLLELNSLGLLAPALTTMQAARIRRGQQVFREIGCAACHVPRLPLVTPVFSEPSTNPAYRDGDTFPAGQSTVAAGVDPAHAITVDLTLDQPDNIIRDSSGAIVQRLGSFTRKNSAGRTLVELYGDLKRHVMGRRLAEPVNEIAGDDVTPNPPDPHNRHTPDTFLTENLWGVGSTAPYMHDGRATTVTEAILEHADPDDAVSEARFALQAFVASETPDKEALIAFLQNLVLFKIEEEEEPGSALRALGFAGGRRQVVKIAPKGFRIVLP
jgi:cytochrome c551/c552/cytochrome c553